MTEGARLVAHWWSLPRAGEVRYLVGADPDLLSIALDPLPEREFFGLLNAPAQIDAARELAQATGGRLPEIGLMSTGEFYAAGEGFSFVKVKAPMCLTHHPKAPLTPEEVIARARA